MTAAVVATRPGALALGRVAAVAALGSAAVHLALLDGGSLGSVVMVVMVVMAAACLPCAWHLWRSPSTRVWAVTAAVDVTMLLLHTQLTSTSHHGTAHSGPAGALAWWALALVTAQLLLAAPALLRR